MDDELCVVAFQAAAPVVLALEKCEPALRVEAIKLFEHLRSGKLDANDVYATAATLAEILFPRPKSESPSKIVAAMNRQEVVFAERLREAMEAKDMGSAQLAIASGVSQITIAAMLECQCRPQKVTIGRLAEVLGVQVADLWHDILLLL